MIVERYQSDLLSLEEIARHQGNKINLSILFITIKCTEEEKQEIIDYFLKREIEIINEDVEPDSDEDAGQITIDSRVNPFDPSKIDIKMDKMVVESIIKRIKNNELEFDSSFQRKAGLWTKTQKSQLIESILLRIPLPAFYFDASDDDKWLIIDGLQRISTIKEYVVDESFALTGLEFLYDLNGLKFSKLPRALQRRIEETNINAYLVNPATPKNVKFNIFKRINTGGLILEPQEIRNALYQGQATEFICTLARNEKFIRATDGSIKTDRMLDREFCLRYVSFTQLPLDTYNGFLDEFLNQGMDYLSKASANDLEQIQNRFAEVMDASYNIFGKNAFRKIYDDGRRRPINKALFEGWSHVIYHMERGDINLLIERREEVVDLFIKRCDDYYFQNALRASDKKSVNDRIRILKTMAERVLHKEVKGHA
ncbi:hypothetical protein HNQ56_002554 [Anaerotaenia torta]|uniref:DUF262 domain-containing protein n=1 Tax=Anaerotaenia torta TaxID=433293 RepID=UPI003D238A07